MKKLNELVGTKVLIRTLSFYQVGQVESIDQGFIFLSSASWIPDTGRFSDCLSKGTFSEVEPVGECIVNLSAICDVFPWKQELPTARK